MAEVPQECLNYDFILIKLVMQIPGDFVPDWHSLWVSSISKWNAKNKKEFVWHSNFMDLEFFR